MTIRGNRATRGSFWGASVILLALGGCAEPGAPEAESSTEAKASSLVSEEKGKPEGVAPVRGPIVAKALQAELATARQSDVIVDVFLPDEDGTFDEEPHFGVAHFDQGDTTYVELDGKPATPVDVKLANAAILAQVRDRAQIRQKLNAASWRALATRYGLGNRLAQAAAIGGDSATLSLPRGALQRMVADANLGAHVRAVTVGFGPVGADDMTSALAATEISTRAFPNSWNGTNIGVWMNDGDGRPDLTATGIPDSRVTLVDVGSEALQTHATQTLATLMAATTGAHVHYAVPTQSCNLRSASSITGLSNPTVYVSSISNNFGDTDSSYSDCTRDWDNFVYNTNIAHFGSPTNSGGQVGGAAKAYNVFAVGNYDDEANPDVVAGTSPFTDPATGADKPDLVAPGTDIDVSDWTGINGTSFATPIAAGFAADLMELRDWLQLRPYLLKAYLYVNGARLTTGGNLGDTDGVGRLDFSNAEFGAGYWWSGSNGSFFAEDIDGDGRLEVSVTRDLTAGQLYHVAISWLVLGTYVRANNVPNMDLDLSIRNPSNTVVGSSSSVSQNYEMVRFTPATSGTYRFVIERFSNSGQGNVRLGLAVRAR